MNEKCFEAIHRINYLMCETNALYHQAALRLGISDSVCMVIYAIYDEQGECLLSEVYKKTGISKQTVNSAMRALEKDGMVRLEMHNGRSKRVVLTEKGRGFAERTAGRIYEAEARMFGEWTMEEISEYIRLTEKYAEGFRRQIEGW